MNNKKVTQNIKQSLEQKPDEFIPTPKKVMDEINAAIKQAESEEYIPPFADSTGMKVRKVIFYPEDIAKMEKMSVEERIKYKGKLKEQRRYTVEE